MKQEGNKRRINSKKKKKLEWTPFNSPFGQLNEQPVMAPFSPKVREMARIHAMDTVGITAIENAKILLIALLSILDSPLLMSTPR
ncbi:MAG TPA: hypothetical protein VLM37_12030 [Fibrobacteraceae bacterium]|nr:hypothetical protein [Fibrobacteraceae bacterium]